MRKCSFDQGCRILIQGQRYRLLNAVVMEKRVFWQARRMGAGDQPIIECFDLVELERRFVDGSLRFDDQQDVASQPWAKRPRRKRPLSDEDQVTQDYVRFWRSVISDVSQFQERCSAQAGRWVTLSKADLVRLLTELGCKRGNEIYGREKRVSISQFYKMKLRRELDLDDLYPKYSGRGNRNQLHPLVKKAMADSINDRLEEAQHLHGGVRPQKFTAELVEKRILKKLIVLRQVHSELTSQLIVPSRTTVCKAINTFDQFRVDAARKGIVRARQDYRRPYGHSEPFAVLSETQYDETKLDVYCYHEYKGVPLGKPNFSWIVDVYSHGILGWYLGFEPPGDTVFSSVLRHCCLPKSYMSVMYPDIEEPIRMSGIPLRTTFDNSLSAHSQTIDQLYSDFDIKWHFCRPREPYTKPDVESAFSTLNRTLLEKLPGYAPPMGRAMPGYDPRANGLISFERLLSIIHGWIAERHSRTLEQCPSLGSPNELWNKGSLIVPPTYIETCDDFDLDAMFGVVRKGHVDHRGARYQNLWYYSDKLDDFRRRRGASINVKMKVNPSDLSQVFVFDDSFGGWIRCESRDASITEGLSLHAHRLIQKHERQLYGRSRTSETYLKSKLDLEESLKEWVTEDYGPRTNALVARALGIGTHSSTKLELPQSACIPAPNAPSSDMLPQEIVIPAIETTRLPEGRI